MPASPRPGFLASHARLRSGPAVCRLGLASRGNTSLDADSVLLALERGINYLNWCGHSSGLSQAIRELGSRRAEVHVAVQLDVATAADADRELDRLLDRLNTDYLDVVTYYYLETAEAWRQITGPGGAHHVLRQAQSEGRVRQIGLTSHQRPLAASIAASGLVDLVMVRYNAAHRGAEREVFPTARARGLPVVAYTALRWGALLEPTPHDPPDARLPTPADCYRFALAAPEVSVVLAAPHTRAELLHDLAILDDWRALDAAAYAGLLAHGDRVRRFAPPFP